MPDSDLQNFPPLYRLHVKTGCADRRATFDFCAENGFLGVGWGMGDKPYTGRRTRTPPTSRMARSRSSARAMYKLAEGTLLWARDGGRGDYYLAEITGPYRYVYGGKANQYDIHNVRPVRMFYCDDSRVPDRVKSAFQRGHAVERIKDPEARVESAELFAELRSRG